MDEADAAGPGTGTSHAAGRSILLFVVVCAIMTGIAGVAEKVAPQLPAGIWVAAAVIGGIAGVVSAWVSYRAAPPTDPPAAAGARGRRSVASAGWLAATVVLALVSFAFPPLFVLAVVTGLVAFRQRRAAFGAALAILFTVALGVLALVLFIFLELATSY